VILVWFTCVVLSVISLQGEACLLCTNVEVLYYHVHMRFMVIFNYGYLVVKNDDTKNG
jgi:hypothetical protein